MSPLRPAETDEVVLTETSELVYRQITEPLMSAETRTPSSIAFAPNSFDDGKPSFARSSKTTPQESRTWHTAKAAKPSLGVWACSVEEVVGAKSQTVDDSAVPRPAGKDLPPGHCYVDYRDLSKSETKILRSTLLAHAIARKEIPST